MTTLMEGERIWNEETCIETLELMFSEPNRIEHLLDLAAERKGAFKEAVAAYILSHPKPDANDILGAEISTRGAWTVLTVRVRRGHYVISDFLHRHSQPQVHKEEGIVVLFCARCGLTLDVQEKSIGRHRGVRAPSCE